MAFTSNLNLRSGREESPRGRATSETQISSGMGLTKVLLFEDGANDLSGHRPHWFAQVAGGLQEEGHEVHVLTSTGWALEEEVGSPAFARVLHRMAPRHRFVASLATRLIERSSIRLFILTFTVLQQVALVVAIRRQVEALGGSRSTRVIILSTTLRAPAVVLFAPRKATWVVYEYGAPRVPTVCSLAMRLGESWARKRELARRSVGGHIAIAANNYPAAEIWRKRFPYLECDVVPSGARNPVQPMSKSDARETLGLSVSDLIALHFGSAHIEKDLETIFSAFASEDNSGHLIVAGQGVKAKLSQWRSLNPGVSFSGITLIDGYVSEDKKHQLYSAADLCILSFRGNTKNDSGTLADAVAYSLPVCCSRGGPTGRMVEEFGLGVLFDAGDPIDLRCAVQTAADVAVEKAGVEAFLEIYSPRATARKLVSLAERYRMDPLKGT